MVLDRTVGQATMPKTLLFTLIACLLIVCLTFVPTALAQSSSDANPDAQLNSLIEKEMRNRRIVGVAISVVRDGSVVTARAFGDAKLRDESAQPATIFFLDSMTKQFTAAGIMLLVQDGRIGVDDPVKKYLPGAPGSWDPIRIRHLLTHTAGLPHDAPWYPTIPEQNCKPDLMLQSLYRLSPQSPPGSRYAYSNAGFATLASIIAKVTGGCYFAHLRSRIFEPLGMQRTLLALFSGERKPGHAEGYSVTPRGVLRLQPPVRHALGGGGIASTVLDLAKWDAALIGDSILSAASKAQMWTPYTLNSGRSTGYGFGWAVTSIPGGKVVHHNGGGFGFTTGFYRFIDADWSVIVLTNTLWRDGPRPPNNGDAIAREVAALYDPRLTWPSRQKPSG